MSKHKPSIPVCPQTQCQDPNDIKALHAGYVKHKNAGEAACPTSTEGHRVYVQQVRHNKKQGASE